MKTTVADIQRKMADNRNRKFRKLFIYKSEISEMVKKDYSIRRIKKEFTKDHKTKVSVGSIHNFIKVHIKGNIDG